MIDKHFSNATASPDFQVHPEAAPKLAAIVQLVREVPEELIRISGSDYSDLILGVAMLDYMVESWRARGGVTVPQKVRKVHALAIVRHALLKCPDQAPSPETTDLFFIEDNELRDSIRQDVSSSYGSLHNGEWKGAAVLAGSAAEALLLWAIKNTKTEQEVEAALRTLTSGQQDIPRKRTRNPDTWGLHDYIEVALALNLITEDTAVQARLGRGFRNLVHPGRAQRLGQRCDRATALSVIAAVEHIARDLS